MPTASPPVPSGRECQAEDILPELLITDLTVEGQGIARYAGEQGSRVVFLDAGLPGELVKARAAGMKKGILHAKLEEILSPSPDRIVPWCPHAGVCGACSWQHFAPETAREWKRKQVRESLARIGKVTDVPVLPVLPSPEMKAFRNKMSFAFAPRTDAGAALGLRRAGTRSLVEVLACGLQPPVVMRILDAVRANVARLGLAAWDCERQGPAARGTGNSGYLRFLVAHTPAYAPGGMPQTLLEFITGPNHEDAAGGGEKNLTAAPSNAEALGRLAQALMAEFPLRGVAHSERSRSTDVAQGERPVQSFGSGDYLERFDHLLLRVPHAVFLQTNTGAATLLYEQIGREVALHPGQILWDVYSGCGSIGLYLAEKVRMAHGFEIREDAVRAANRNKRALRYANCHFHIGGLKPAALEALPLPDVVVLDPPRSGVEEEVIEVLLHVPARTLLYASCNAATQARDAARLSSVWTAVKSQPIDMFPYTPHVENLLVFKRKENGIRYTSPKNT